MKVAGKDIAKGILDNLTRRVERLKEQGITPHLVVILVGTDPGSLAYIRQKQRKAEYIAAKVTVLSYPEDITTIELLQKISELNDDKNVHGIIVQRPLPAHIDTVEIDYAVTPEKDIDGFHPESHFHPPIALAVVKILEEVYCYSSSDSEFTEEESRSSQSVSMVSHDEQQTKHIYNHDLAGFFPWLTKKNIVVVGKGVAGGRPIITHLQEIGVEPHIIDSQTPHPEKILTQADIIISAVGKEHVIRANVLHQSTILIGVGLHTTTDGKLRGDYDEEDIQDKAAFYTPTPGGVGPVNVTMLLSNLILATEHSRS